MVKAIFVFSQTHTDFRIAEFEAVCEIFTINVDLSPLNAENHICVLEFSTIDDVHKILSRCVLVKFAVEYFAEGQSYEQLYQEIEDKKLLKNFDNVDDSFAIRVFAIGRKKRLDLVEKVKTFLDNVTFTQSPVNLRTPKNEFYLVEEYEKPIDNDPSQVYFGKFIGDGQYLLKTRYNLKDRCYIGNTTMDPELAFLQANISRVSPGEIVLDPFVGTGGLILSAAEFGGLVVGMEINYQTANAIGKSSRKGVGTRGDDESIQANFEQQGTQDRLLSIIIGDSSKHEIWSRNSRFDVIVADPPYGVREKGRKVGKNLKSHRENAQVVRFPQKQEYDLEKVYCDLLNLAAKICAIGGRVSFWYPVILEIYSDENLPKHPAMKLIANCEQTLTRNTSRRLLTYKKLRNPEEYEIAEILKTGVSKYRSTLFKSKN
ncbi:unnamed protein product [Caenorhabditis bovis]|uniref:tRNA (guanine(10)-N(2))-methyltransferase TRMT11 n=1 Tax=Caenorhabditis bovis TaxID=2654633 RepID=A0A8S1F9S1_9PELO|nr:unnamed protein product [Caenorhabditis bovis]